MTIWYFDPVNGLDANNGTSSATPKQNYFIAGTVAGDTFLFKRGTTFNFSDYWPVRSGSSDSVRTRYGAYGVAQVPYATFKNPTGLNGMIFNGAQSKFITFEDMYFDMASTGIMTQSIYCAAQGAVQTTDNIIRRCFFTGAATSGSGLSISRESSATVGPANYVVEDCEFWGNSAHGLFISGANNCVVRRSKFHHNGFDAPTGGHGFSARALYASAPSGWTNTGGNVWRYTLVAPATDAYYVRLMVAGFMTRLTRTAGSPTAPGVGQYGVSAGVLHIYSTVDPNGKSADFVYALCSNIIVEDSAAWGNYSDPAVGGTEGHGFVYDDWADNSIFRRNKSYDNEGFGFSINKGNATQILSNLAFNNGGPGILTSSDGSSIIHNTFQANNQIPIHARDAEIFLAFGYNNGVVSNNIIKGSGTYGINNDPANTGFSGTKNVIHGFEVADRSAFVTGTVTVDPLFDALYRPTAATVKRAGTYLGGKDFNGKHFYNPPSIGAVDDVSTTPRYLLTNP